MATDVPIKMPHNTVAAIIKPQSAKSTKTLGRLAEHSPGRLKDSFPGSPLFDDYTPASLETLRTKILQNDVQSSDRGDSQAYWGFPQVEPSEEAPSSVDLSFAGAPQLEKWTILTPEGEDEIVSPFFPILSPPSLSLSLPQKEALAKTRRQYVNNLMPNSERFSEAASLNPKKSSEDITKVAVSPKILGNL